MPLLRRPVTLIWPPRPRLVKLWQRQPGGNGESRQDSGCCKNPFKNPIKSQDKIHITVDFRIFKHQECLKNVMCANYYKKVNSG